MMGSNGQTIITYAGGGPTVDVALTLFDSSVAFPSVQTPSGGSFHLLGLQWFQFTLGVSNAGGTGTGVITGQYSIDKGSNWVTFYATAALATGATATPGIFEDEVYVGMFKDIRFQVTYTTAVPTVFQVQLALNPHKPTSRSASADRLVNTSLAL